MRAAVIREFDKDLAVEQVPDPDCPENGLVLEVAACGVCRSDYHGWTGHHPKVRPGDILGHEYCGTVVEAGPKAKHKVGDRLIAPFILACGDCPACYSGVSNTCENAIVPGFGTPGAYAEYVAVPFDHNLVHLPDAMSPALAAGLGCRVTTAWHALTDRAAVQPGEWVAVHGTGGIGLATLLLAKALGARVVVVDIVEEKLTHAMAHGADAAVDARMRDGAREVPDLLDLLLAGEDPKSGRTMTPAEIRDNLLTFIVAGHETTALSLAWSFYLCAFDQDVQDRARAEAQAVLGDRAATGDDIQNLPYIRQIIDEAVGLYPPAGIVSRTARADDTLAGADIRAGDTVMIPIYALHRSHLLWDNPDAFDPDRFADRKAIPRYAYLPFGDGPRICIGASFALQEAVIILATLLARYRFTPVPGRAPAPVMIVTLRPAGGVWLMAEPA